MQRLTLNNFQCYEVLELEFDPRITTIVGPSDVGKSTIVRALRWVCLNRPTGANYARTGTDEATAELVIDGHTITRRKGKANEYLLDGEKYAAFGTGVPEDVIGLLNVDENNFQEQIDGPFWFGVSAPQVSRELNAIVDLDVIDQSFQFVNAALRKSTGEVELIQTRIDEATAKHSELDWVDHANDELRGLEALQKELSKSLAHAAVLRSLLETIDETSRSEKRWQGAAQRAQSLYQRHAELVATVTKRNRLAKLVDRIETVTNLAESGIGTVARDADRLVEITTRAAALSSALQQIETAKETQCQNQKKASEIGTRLAQQKRCPICGTKM